MLVSEDHTRHPIIRRQLTSFGRAGAELTVLDRRETEQLEPAVSYTAVSVRPVSLWLLAKAVWIVLRRIRSPHLGEAWWTVIHILQVFLSAIPYALLAFRANADFYQAHDLYALLPALIVGKLRGRRVVYDAHELVSEQGDPRSMRNHFERILERWLVPRADDVVVPSRSRGQLYVRRYGLHVEPVVVLNCAPTVAVSKSNLLRDRLGLPASTRIVLYHGTFMPGRALEQLVLSVREYDEGIALVLIGQANRFSQDVLRPLRDAERLGHRLFFMPYVAADEIMQHVASADLGVVIYKNINLNNYLCAPTKLYEYLMAGVPVVVSGFPEMLSLLQEFPVGRAFDPDEPSSIAGAVNGFFRSEQLEHVRLVTALERAQRTFNWEHESRKLLRVFGLQAGEG